MGGVYVAQLCIGSVLASTGLIILNKTIVQFYNFPYVLCLTTCHFAFTSVMLECWKWLGIFQPVELPRADIHRLALGAFGSIATMNLSLAANSIGVYQMGKLACIPYMVFYQSTFLGTRFSKQTKLALTAVVLGMGIAVVTDVHLNAIGCMYTAVAVLTTSHFQTWQGSKQREHQVDPVQIQYATALPTAIYSGLAAVLFDGILAENSGFLSYSYSTSVLGMILSTCVFAMAVNTLSYALIGQTSPVTYQVVGHAKTCLVLSFGFVVFGYEASAKNLLGIAVAVGGLMYYSHIKLNASAEKSMEIGSTSARNPLQSTSIAKT